MIDFLTYTAKVIRSKFVSDKAYLSKRFQKKLGYSPNLEQPSSFNEKVTARMLFERNPLHTKLADKFAVRTLISERIGTDHLVPLLGVYSRFTDIDFDALPTQFVLKCTHDSGSAVICSDKSRLDLKQLAHKTQRHLKRNMYYRKREWHYKHIRPKILIEQFVPLYRDVDSQNTIQACRVHCFEGRPHYIEVDVQDAQGSDYSNIYDTAWQLQPFHVDGKDHSPLPLLAPQQLAEMLNLAERLCFKYSYSRIDFLLSADQVFFGEITLTPNAGRMPISPSHWDQKLGALWLSY